MKKTRTIRAPYARRQTRMKELAVSVQGLLDTFKHWRTESEKAADEITVQILLVEKAMGRLL